MVGGGGPKTLGGGVAFEKITPGQEQDPTIPDGRGWGEVSSEKLHRWILKRLPKKERRIISTFIEERKRELKRVAEEGGDVNTNERDIEMLMTPFPISLVLAKRMEQVLTSMGMVTMEKDGGPGPNGTAFTFMDPLGGSGADSYAVVHHFKRHVVVTAADINPINVQLMKRLMESYNKKETPPQLEEETEEETNMHGDNDNVRIVESQGFDVENMCNVNVLYLDPLWPKSVKKDYMIDPQHTLVDVVKRAFEVDPALRMVVCKVSSDYVQGPTRVALRDFCIGNSMRMEEFFPIGGVKKNNGKGTVPLHGDEVCKVIVPQERIREPQKWDEKQNKKISGGFPSYSGTIRFIIITRPPTTTTPTNHSNSNWGQGGLTKETLRSLDVSIFR